MADKVMSTYISSDPVRGTSEIIARDLGIQSYMKGIHTVKTGQTGMKPGMIVTTFGETGRDIDIFTDGDLYATGIVLGLRNRLYAADGSISGNAIDTAFAADSEVSVLYFGYHVASVYMWLTGMDADTIDDGTGLVRKGAPVYLLNSSPAALAATNWTVGSAMAFGASQHANAPGTTVKKLQQIGILQVDGTIADSNAAVGGIIAKVLI